MIKTIGRICASAPKPPWKKIRKVCIYFSVVSKKQTEAARSRIKLFTIRTQPLGELSPEFREIARPDRLPYTSHGVKEEGQIMVGQEHTRQHFPGHV